MSAFWIHRTTRIDHHQAQLMNRHSRATVNHGGRLHGNMLVTLADSAAIFPHHRSQRRVTGDLAYFFRMDSTHPSHRFHLAVHHPDTSLTRCPAHRSAHTAVGYLLQFKHSTSRLGTVPRQSSVTNIRARDHSSLKVRTFLRVKLRSATLCFFR